MRAMAFGHLVPARPEDPGSLAHHPEEQGALFGPFEQSRRSRPRFPQPTEGRAESEAKKVRGAQEGGKRRRVERTASDSMARPAASQWPRSAHRRAPVRTEGPSTGREREKIPKA